ncbi:cyclin PHO80-like protein, partial [Blyttiomyces helicus]
FHARTIPTIDIGSYLNRVLKYAPCPNECFLAVLVYLGRMAAGGRREGRGRIGRERTPPHPLVIVNSYNVHRLLISGIMVAVKLMSDVFFTNLHISRVGGLPVNELNQLEIEFLILNDFNLNVSLEELQR